MGKDFFEKDGIPIKILRRDPQPVYPIHTHDFSELVIVLNGHGTHFTMKNKFQVGAGDLFVINGDLAHGYRDLDKLILINVLFDLERMGMPPMDISRSPGFHTLFSIDPVLRGDLPFASRLKLIPSQMDEVVGLIRRIEREMREGNEGFRYMATALFMQLITLLSRSCSENRQENDRDFYRLGEAISYIEHNLQRNISIGELLEICPMSESSLQRAFKKITGTSAIDFHLKKRIDLACTLLKESDKPITMIAYDTGFSDSNYFSRQFKKIRGESPRDYRQRMSN
jgi:AraC-like DNA-binding protein